MSESDPYWRLKELFAAALEKPAPERDAFVQSQAGDDAPLLLQVRSLLEAHERSTALFAQTAPQAKLRVDFAGEKVGDQIGPYKLLEHVGEGGMGVVYKAEQVAPVRRIVALKLIKLGMDTRQVIARFESERQALALMNHPNVAAVYDGGATQSGRPYFVMEWVSGTPITSFCDQHSYSTRQRLELFNQACDAIQHAHQKAIIHRDIKPGNILVALDGDKPLVKVIDFGVAKATQMQLTEKTLFTETGQLVGTPEYMSPEQADLNAVDIDTRTDIYSLGVVLYELLVGALPFDSKELRRAAYARIQTIIRDVDPPRPSARLSSLGVETAGQIAALRHTELATLERELRNELEWIPLKAMRKDRAQRYATAIDLAADVSNYLTNRALNAAPESRAYRAKKFLRRNQRAVIAVSAIALALIAGVIGTTIGLVGEARQRREAQRQEHLAQNQSAIATAVSGFQSTMLSSADPDRSLGDKVTVLQAITAAVVDLDKGALSAQPLVEAHVRTTIAATFRSIGRYREAEQNFRRAIELFKSAGAESSSDSIEAMSLLGATLDSQGNANDAIPVLRHAIEIGRTTGVEDRSAASALDALGLILRDHHELEEAEQLMRDGLRIRRKLADPVDVANSLHNLAMLQRRRRQLDDAETLLREALAIYQQTRGPRHPYVAACLHNLGGLLHDHKKYPEAEQFYRQSLEIYRATLPADHPYIGTTLNDLGYVLQEQGKFADALPLHQEALAGFEKSVGKDHWNSGNSNYAIGRALAGMHRYGDAEAPLLESNRVFAFADHATDFERLKCAEVLASLYSEWDKTDPGNGHDVKARQWSETHNALLQKASR